MEHIDISNNFITNCSNILLNFPNLYTVYLNHNKLSEINNFEIISKMNNLCEVYITDNNFCENDEQICKKILSFNKYIEVVNYKKYNDIGYRDKLQQSNCINKLVEYKLYNYDLIEDFNNNINKELNYKNDSKSITTNSDDQITQVKNTQELKDINNLEEIFFETKNNFNIITDKINNLSLKNSEIFGITEPVKYNKLELRDSKTTDKTQIQKSLSTNINSDANNTSTTNSSKIPIITAPENPSRKSLNNFKIKTKNSTKLLIKGPNKHASIAANITNLKRENEYLKRLLNPKK